VKYNEIIKSIDDKKYNNIYFLSGSESYYIDKISEYISKNILNEEEKAFNQAILYGKETNVKEIISEAKQYPFGAINRVIIVKEAQHVRNIENLDTYLENPLITNVLVICYKKKIDARKKIFKNLKKNNYLFESNQLYENQIANWINEYCNEKGISITNESCAILAQHLGNNLSKITNELEKLLINISQDEKITPIIIEKNIGISKDYNVFELQNSLGNKNILQSNKIANFLSANSKNNPFVLTISSIFSFFKKVLIYKQISNLDRSKIASTLKINPYFVNQYQTASKNYSYNQLKKIFQFIEEYELRSKGIGNYSTSTDSLLKELIFKILHA
jgi:DNA polymerase-3 subunit delta